MPTRHSLQTYSPYRRGAEDGLLTGAMLSAGSICMMLAIEYPVANLGFLLMLLMVPVWTAMRLRRTFVACGGVLPVSALWMQGIMMFMCGALIMALATYGHMRVVQPDFLALTLEHGLEAIEQSPMFSDYAAGVDAEALRRAATPRSWAMELMWTTVFTGSLLSLLLAVLARIRQVKPRQQTK